MTFYAVRLSCSHPQRSDYILGNGTPRYCSHPECRCMREVRDCRPEGPKTEERK